MNNTLMETQKTTIIVTDSTKLAELVKDTFAKVYKYATFQEWQLMEGSPNTFNFDEIQKTLFGSSRNSRKKTFRTANELLNNNITPKKAGKFFKLCNKLSNNSTVIMYGPSKAELQVVGERSRFKADKEKFKAALELYTKQCKDFKKIKKLYTDSGKVFTF